MTLLAGFNTLLYRYTGQDDVVVGTNVAGRNVAEIENLIGFFVNMLVLRGDCSGGASFRQLLRRVREMTLEAFAHQELPFEMLVEELQPQRNLSHSPLFQVVFSLQNAPQADLVLPGLKLTVPRLEHDTAKYDVVLNMWERGGGLEGSLEYNTDLFDRGTAEGMLRHYRNLLAGVVEDADHRWTSCRC